MVLSMASWMLAQGWRQAPQPTAPLPTGAGHEKDTPVAVPSAGLLAADRATTVPPS